MARGAVEVRVACEAALAELAGAFSSSGVVGSRDQWAAAVAAAQAVINVASAVQDAAMVRLAGIEPQWLDDGTVVESHRGLGHVALDAPAIVSAVLSTSAGYAESRVRTAVRLAADGPPGSSTETGLGGLHTAMAAGRLDPYRAAVVAEELEHAPAQVAATVVAALEGHFAVEDGTHLRRRCRRVLTRISPDLLHQRAARARAGSRLRRWADEPGVDHWEGTFPSEEAAQAWAAIDALARQYVAAGSCATIDRARAKALTDLVAGHATITTVLTVTVPATAIPHDAPTGRPDANAVPDATVVTTAPRGGGLVPFSVADAGDAEPAPAGAEADPADAGDPAAAGDELVEVTGPGAADPVLVSRRWLSEAVHTASVVQVAPCHPETGALLDDGATTHTTAGTPNARRPHTGDGPPGDHPAGTGDAEGGDADRAVRAVGGVAATAGSGPDRYRPSPRLVKQVRARDRRCRFPGCTIAAVFCDLDHVRPWPTGPTRHDNLICLCRRHHRVKQRPGWHLTLAPDAVATWTDPTGRARTTHPIDALTTTILRPSPRPGATTPATPSNTSRPRTLVPDGPHTVLEFHLEHLGTPPPQRSRRQPPALVTAWRDQHGTRHRNDLLPARGSLVLDQGGYWPHHPARRTDHSRETDTPPF